MRKMCKSARLVSEVARLAKYRFGRLHYFVVACWFCDGVGDSGVFHSWGRVEHDP